MSQRTKTTKKPAKLLDYANLLGQVKERIRHAQVRAVLSVNAELIRLYWDIGRMLEERQVKEGYGTAIIPRLARDLRNELPEVKGFSERNIGRMIAFFRAYPRPAELLPQPVAKVVASKVSPRAVAKLKASEKVPQPVAHSLAADSVLWSVPWGHHALLLEKVKDLDHRLWYMGQTLQHGSVRFFKSFNFDFLRKNHPKASPYPWEKIDGAWFPFVKVPLCRDITTIVGANESGKSHLLGAITKGLSGRGIARRDFCRYSPFFTVEQGKIRKPDFGFHFAEVDEEKAAVLQRMLDPVPAQSFSQFW